MLPVIRVGDLVKVIKFSGNGENLNSFDIIMFWDGDILLCHYVWNINKLIKNRDGKNISIRSLKESDRTGVLIDSSQIVGIVNDYKISYPLRAFILLKIFFSRSQ